MKKTQRETEYIDQMKALDIYDPIFDPAIKNLARLERELTRAQKEWSEEAKKAGRDKPSFTSKLYPVIQDLRAEIERSRDSLGLTPKGLKRIKGDYYETVRAGEMAEEVKTENVTVLESILKKYAV